MLARLVARSADGDWEAFGMLYAMTSSQLYGLMRRMTRESAVCEDLLQDVYVSVWRRADRYSPDRAGVMTWLVTIARNRTFDWLRSQGSGIEGLTVGDGADAFDLATGEDEPARSAGRSAADAALEACMDALSSEQRQAIHLAYLEGYTHAELAKRLTSPLGTVKSWVRRGLEHLKRCLAGSEAAP